MKETFTRWDPLNYLKTDEDFRLYLEACADEDPGDGSLIRAALDDIVRLYGATQAYEQGQAESLRMLPQHQDRPNPFREPPGRRR